MTLGRAITCAKLVAFVLTTIALSASPAVATPVKTEKAACALVKASVSASRHFPISTIAFCDMATNPRGYYVLALHSSRRCDGFCSTNMGWFAVRKATGRVYEWNVADDNLGQTISIHP